MSAVLPQQRCSPSPSATRPHITSTPFHLSTTPYVSAMSSPQSSIPPSRPPSVVPATPKHPGILQLLTKPTSTRMEQLEYGSWNFKAWQCLRNSDQHWPRQRPEALAGSISKHRHLRRGLIQGRTHLNNAALIPTRQRTAHSTRYNTNIFPNLRGQTNAHWYIGCQRLGLSSIGNSRRYQDSRRYPSLKQHLPTQHCKSPKRNHACHLCLSALSVAAAVQSSRGGVSCPASPAWRTIVASPGLDKSPGRRWR